MIEIPEWIGADAPAEAMRRLNVAADGERIVYTFDTIDHGDLKLGDKRAVSLPHADRLAVFDAEVVGFTRTDSAALVHWRAVV